jgi:hypothetical protein
MALLKKKNLPEAQWRNRFEKIPGTDTDSSTSRFDFGQGSPAGSAEDGMTEFPCTSI